MTITVNPSTVKEAGKFVIDLSATIETRGEDGDSCLSSTVIPSGVTVTVPLVRLVSDTACPSAPCFLQFNVTEDAIYIGTRLVVLEIHATDLPPAMVNMTVLDSLPAPPTN